MEIQFKYQYTYFIYPYIIDKNKYDKYLLKLLNNKNCNLKVFEKEKDLDIYSYFIPQVREYMFPTFEFSKKDLKNIKAVKEMPCVMFEYRINDDTQGKIGKEEGVFFKIEKMEIICFKSGICFLILKTHIDGSQNFSDLLNFNYKFKSIYSKFNNLREYENIKIQTDTFETTQDITDLIKNITGVYEYNTDKEDIIEKFFTYTYTCIDSEYWNDKKSFEDNITDDFLKFSNILPSSSTIDLNKQNISTVSDWKYIRCGFNKLSCALLTSGVDTYNYTKLPYIFENEYLYTLIISLYQKIYLNKIKHDFSTKNNQELEVARKEFVEFTKNIWLNEITNNDIGSIIYKKWHGTFEIKEIYEEIKSKYDVIYKDLEISKNKVINILLIIVVTVALLFNMANLITAIIK